VGARMNPRTAAWLAWSLWVLTSALTGLSLVLLVLNLSHQDVRIFSYWAEYTWGAVAFSTVGAVIASRRPENRIGWIFCAAGLVAGVHHFSAEYAIHAAPEKTLLASSLTWIASWTWVPYIGLLLSLGLLFPRGRLPTRRWRPYAALVVAVCLAGAALVALAPGPISGLGSVENPAGIEGLGAIGGVRADYLVQAALGALALATALSMFKRLLSARGEERQQLKWFAYAAAVLACGVVIAYTVAPLIAVSWVNRVGFGLVVVGTLSVPIAVGIAILRHHLYDIDILINRTLVYGTLTATLRTLCGGEAQGCVAFRRNKGRSSRPLRRCACPLLLLDDQFPHTQPSDLKLLYVEALDPAPLHRERPNRQSADRQSADRHRAHCQSSQSTGSDRHPSHCCPPERYLLRPRGGALRSRCCP
jgi:hypothetical protein